jgi:hypothetical protein
MEERDMTKAENARLKERVKKQGPQSFFWYGSKIGHQWTIHDIHMQ